MNPDREAPNTNWRFDPHHSNVTTAEPPPIDSIARPIEKFPRTVLPGRNRNDLV